MSLEIKSVPRPSWTPLPYEGCHGVKVKVLLTLDHLGVAMLSFEKNAAIHEHPAPIDIDVICLEGRGMTSIGNQQAPIQAGERVRWPANTPHRLWTEGSEMVTLMVEHSKITDDE